MLEKTVYWMKRISVLTMALFAFELIFGFTGTTIIIHDFAIRELCFLLAFFTLYLYFFLYLLANKIRIFGRKRDSYFGSYQLFDWLYLAFFLSTVVSFLIIPRLTGVSTYYAKCEIFSCICVMTLYFPIGFLVRKGEFPLEKFERYLYILFAVFAVQHIVFYIGLTININFVQSIFDLLSAFFSRMFGDSQFPIVILGLMNTPRVIFSTSVYLIFGVALILKRFSNLRWYDYVILALDIVAILSTMTKSFWYGVLFGFVLYLLLFVIYQVKVRNKGHILQMGIVVLVTVVAILLSNLTIFNNMVSGRFFHSFNLEGTEMEITDESDFMEVDLAASAISNSIKVEQTKYLLEKWKERPIFGFGYGAYVEGYLRSEEAPFSYEMQFPCLLMKIGIFGIGILLALLISMGLSLIQPHRAFQNFYGNMAWFFFLLSFILCVQTNPLLLNYNGMSIVVYLVACCASLNLGKIKSDPFLPTSVDTVQSVVK